MTILRPATRPLSQCRDGYLLISTVSTASIYPIPTDPIPPCFASAGDAACICGSPTDSLFTLDQGCRRTLVIIPRCSHSTSALHTGVYTLDEGCLPCVRRPGPMCPLIEMIDYPVREIHSGRGVSSQPSTLLPDGGLFTLDQGCVKPAPVWRFHSGLGVPVCVGNSRSESDFTRDRLDPL